MLFSASLGQLALSKEAIPNNTDSGGIVGVLDQLGKLSDLSDLLGTIIINADAWTADTAADLQRVEKDAEVAAACLVAWQHKDHASETDELKVIFADMVFEARHMGTGAKLMCSKLGMISKDEVKRDYVGMSFYRLSKYLTELANQVDVEKLFAEKQSSADRMMAMLEREGLHKGWKAETMSRYLALGRRLASPKIASLMDKWEFFHKRRTVVDTLANLRGVLQACDTDDEVEFVLKTLYLEQRCELRETLVNLPKTTTTQDMPHL